MATFQILDQDGKVLRTEEKSFQHYKRYSMKCRAEQRFLDSLYVDGASKGRIIKVYLSTPLNFKFVNGKSEFLE